MVIIFTDGSSRGNPGPGGWGVVILSPDLAIELGGREENTTNNRMELLAVISAIEFIPQEKEMIIHTDSAYVVLGITRWVKGWVLNKWKTSKKEEVLNKDLWHRLLSVTAHKIIQWELIPGHAGIPGNERCDVIATSFADNNSPILYKGSRSRYRLSISISAIPPAKKIKSKSKAYSYVSLVDGKIEKHKTWEECKSRIHAVSKALFKKSVSPQDEEEIIKEFTE